MSAHKISEINIYPIKSLGGISLEQAKALPRGFEYDRRWMLVDEQGVFLTQREHAQMALFSCRIEEDELVVSYKEEEQRIGLSNYLEQNREVEVWSSALLANEVDKKISEWFSDHLGMSATLVKMTENSKRLKALKVAPQETELSFADGYPYLILGEASMQELNSRLAQPLPADRFRANIMVTTDKAHEEDGWSESFKVGSAKMKVIKPCARCVVTTIDQQTAAKGKEPLKSLASYRQWDNKIWFGANAICMEEGQIKVGDVISF